MACLRRMPAFQALLLCPGTIAFIPGRPAFQASIRSAQPARFASKITAADVLRAPKWPEAWPYTDADFARMDETSDGIFYENSRLVYHIDDSAVTALTDYYRQVFGSFKKPPDVLDICSSWVSHYPKDVELGNVCGVGMNGYELEQNPQLSSFVAKDLNVEPKLPHEDDSFDVVTCVVSVDYLNKPRQIFEEISRVLKPGGRCIISCSNRCFPTKAIAIWLQTNDLEHVFIVGSFFHYAGGFEPPFALDISPYPGRSDPMYIIEAKKGQF